MKNIISIALFVVSSTLAGCATTEHTVHDIETQTGEVKGTTNDGKIVINDKHQIIIQKESAVDDEIRTQEMVNMHFHDALGYEAFALNECRISLADPKLGGSGEVAPLPKIPPVDPDFLASSKTEEMGLNEDGDLKIVTRQFLDQRLSRLRKHQKTLEAMIDTVKPMREECVRKLGYKTADTYTTTTSDRTVTLIHTSK